VGRIYKSPCGRIELREGKWQDVLRDVDRVDAVITDPPYGERTHRGHAKGTGELNAHGKYVRKDISYKPFSVFDVERFCEYWSPLCRGWFCVFTDHDLYPIFRSNLEAMGRYSFNPLPIVRIGGRFRMMGDGPSSWTVWLSVSRPRDREYGTWGCLPGAYVFKGAVAGSPVAGAKSIDESSAIIRDYSRPNDLICDPCAGSGTTLLAAAIEGRRAIGAEMDPKTYELAVKRLKKGYTPSLF